MLLMAVVNVASVSCKGEMGHSAVESIFHSWSGERPHQHHGAHEHHGDRCCESDADEMRFAAHHSCDSAVCSHHEHPQNCQDQKLLDDSLRENETLLVKVHDPCLDVCSYVRSIALSGHTTVALGTWQQRGPPAPQQFLLCLSKVRLLI